jgi:hypothetical protein
MGLKTYAFRGPKSEEIERERERERVLLLFNCIIRPREEVFLLYTRVVASLSSYVLFWRKVYLNQLINHFFDPPLDLDYWGLEFHAWGAVRSRCILAQSFRC